jgi:hypothetical protein
MKIWDKKMKTLWTSHIKQCWPLIPSVTIFSHFMSDTVNKVISNPVKDKNVLWTGYELYPPSDNVDFWSTSGNFKITVKFWLLRMTRTVLIVLKVTLNYLCDSNRINIRNTWIARRKLKLIQLIIKNICSVLNKNHI